jgi:lipopolysaccharide transport system ATP-binding protein
MSGFGFESDQHKHKQDEVVRAPVTGGDPEIAIEVKDISKLYRLYPGQRARVLEWFSFGKKKYHHPFWALKNVDLTLHKGKALGIIGPNGSGKSTLLKLIAGTSSPTSGSIKVNGTVAALLELGAGFHPEFSGRQNIRMNAQIFGLSEKEIDGIMDDVIDFSELDRFIDMPVKTYSSGMYARLGFSVASHLYPDILIVDEALSVGDTYFQRKCLDRIIFFREQGRTIIFVSHIMPVVQRFCDEVIWLQEGEIRMSGTAEKVIKSYDMWSLSKQERHLNKKVSGHSKSDQQKREYKVLDESWGTGEAKLIHVEMLNEKGEPTWTFNRHERNVTLRMHYYAYERIETPIVGINFHRIDGIYIFGTSNHHIETKEFPPIEGFGYIDYKIDRLYLHRGQFFLSCGLYPEPDVPYWTNPLDWHNQKYEFTVADAQEAHGIVPLQGEWQVKHSPAVTDQILPSVLEFTDVETQYFIQKGWWQIEKTPDFAFAWTRQDAHFVIFAPQGSSGLTVNLKTNKPDVADDNVTVTLLYRGKECSSIVLKDNDWQTVTFETPEFEENTIAHFTLVTDPCWVPQDFGHQGDDRIIGIGISRIEISSDNN